MPNSAKVNSPFKTVTNQKYHSIADCQAAFKLAHTLLLFIQEKKYSAEKNEAKPEQKVRGAKILDVSYVGYYTVRESNPGLARGRGVFYH